MIIIILFSKINKNYIKIYLKLNDLAYTTFKNQFNILKEEGKVPISKFLFIKKGLCALIW